MSSGLDFGLAGKAAIITGGAKGIGRAAAIKLVAAGARVALFDMDEVAGEALAEELENAHFWPVDVADAAQVEAAVAAVVAQFGGLDLLVNNAGIAPPRTLDNMADGDWERVLQINLTGAYNCTRAVVPHLDAAGDAAEDAGGGAIVNVASVAGKNISMGAGMHYTASKWGLIGFSRHMAYELAPRGIRVNIVCPGPTRTPLITPGKDAASLDKIGASLPLGRLVEPTDVANAILFFLSPLSAMCAGAELVVDGGVLIGSGHAYDDYFQSRGSSAPARKVTPKEG